MVEQTDQLKNDPVEMVGCDRKHGCDCIHRRSALGLKQRMLVIGLTGMKLCIVIPMLNGPKDHCKCSRNSR